MKGREMDPNISTIPESTGDTNSNCEHPRKTDKPEVFDSSGLFHFCESRSFSEAVVVSTDTGRHLVTLMILEVAMFTRTSP